jgi:hypothetical protein
MRIPSIEKDFRMGYLSLTRRDGENIRLTIDPGVDADKLLKHLLRDGITIRIDTRGQGAVRVGIEAPKQVGIYREELLDV